MENRYFIIQPHGYGIDEKFLEVKDIEEAKEIIGEKDTYEARDYILDNYSGPDNWGFYLNDSKLSLREVDEKGKLIEHREIEINKILSKNIPTKPIELEEDLNYIYLKEDISGSFRGIQVTISEDFNIANLVLKANYSISGKITVYDMDYKNAVEVEGYDDWNYDSDIDYGYLEANGYLQKFDGRLSLTICNEREEKSLSIPMSYKNIKEMMLQEKEKLLSLIEENDLSQERIARVKERLSDIENGFNLDTIVLYNEDEFNMLIERSK